MTDSMVSLVTLTLSLGWLLFAQGLAKHYGLASTLSRKIIHIGTGPLFVLCWPLFSDNPYSRWFAALVPIGLTLVFGLVGLGWLGWPLLVNASTRNGAPAELLKGPLQYGIAFIVCTVVFWRSSPIGILALMMLCGGDGFADIVGRRWGQRKLPFSPDKSWAGSGAMFLSCVGFGLGFLVLFNGWGYFSPVLLLGQMITRVVAIALVATMVEALPIADIDNLTLTITVVGLGLLWF